MLSALYCVYRLLAGRAFGRSLRREWEGVVLASRPAQPDPASLFYTPQTPFLQQENNCFTTKLVEVTLGCESIEIQLLTTDILVLATMKNAAKCDT